MRFPPTVQLMNTECIITVCELLVGSAGLCRRICFVVSDAMALSSVMTDRSVVRLVSAEECALSFQMLCLWH